MKATDDIRFSFLEQMLAKLSQQLNGTVFGSPRRLSPLLSKVREMGKLIAAMKYSYLEDEQLKEMPEQERLRELASGVIDTLVGANQDQRDKLALLRFYRLVASQFKDSFGLGATLESMVPVEIGEVQTVSKHPKAKNLVLCRVQVFDERLEIVTNLTKTRAGQRMKVAMVLPAEVMGVLSEAQFVGPAEDGPVGARPALGEHEQSEIRKTMGTYLEG